MWNIVKTNKDLIGYDPFGINDYTRGIFSNTWRDYDSLKEYYGRRLTKEDLYKSSGLDKMDGVVDSLKLVLDKSTKDEFVYVLDVPGFSKSDISVELFPGNNFTLLKIKGDRAGRKLSVEYKIDTTKTSIENVKAECLDGVLTLRFKKPKELEKAKSIVVKVD